MTEKRKPKPAIAVDRRTLLAGLTAGAAALALPAAVEASAPPPAATPADGYRETEHVRRAYRSFAF